MVIKQEVAHLVFLSVDVVVHHHPTPAQSSGGTKAHGRPKPLCCYPFNVVFVVFAGLRKLSSTHWQDNTNCVRCIYTLSAAGPPWPLLAPMGFSASLSPRTPAHCLLSVYHRAPGVVYCAGFLALFLLIYRWREARERFPNMTSRFSVRSVLLAAPQRLVGDFTSWQ